MSGQPGRVGHDGEDGRPGAAQQAGRRWRGQGRRVRQALADALPRGDARQRRAVVGARAEQQDPRRPGDVRRAGPAGRPAAARAASACEERGEVLAGVVAARIDEVATGQPEPLALRGGVVVRRQRTVRSPPRPGRRGEGRPRGQRDDPDPVRADVEQAAGGGLHRRAGDDHGGRVAQQAAAQALPEPRRRGAPERLRQLPRRQVEQRRHDRQARGDRERPGAGRVVDRAGGPARGRRARPRRATPRAAGTGRRSSPPERSRWVGGSCRRPTTARFA